MKSLLNNFSFLEFLNFYRLLNVNIFKIKAEQKFCTRYEEFSLMKIGLNNFWEDNKIMKMKDAELLSHRRHSKSLNLKGKFTKYLQNSSK